MLIKLKTFIFIGVVIIFVVGGWFVYQQMTDNTYKGMSIVPEQTNDIPLFKGLKPTEHEYIMKGNYANEIWQFYLDELPKHGWKVEYEQNLVESGFMTRWRKADLNWELSVTGTYFKTNDQTQVIFRKNPIYTSTKWIEHIPASVCVHEDPNKSNTCVQITDQKKIAAITAIINKAIDWEREAFIHPKRSVLEIGDLMIKVDYGGDKEIVLKSAKGMKVMKPELEFFELTGLPKQ